MAPATTSPSMPMPPARFSPIRSSSPSSLIFLGLTPAAARASRGGGGRSGARGRRRVCVEFEVLWDGGGGKGLSPESGRARRCADQPSFSSTLLNAIYKSMDKPDIHLVDLNLLLEEASNLDCNAYRSIIRCVESCQL
ncbi:hypothetical protein ACP4OV_019217 [Aristida adscensionis]